jgi:serine/threonine protein kinase, bacterial
VERLPFVQPDMYVPPVTFWKQSRIAPRPAISCAVPALQRRYPNGMPPDKVVTIIRAIADALDYAHQKQLRHRDVKPSNILMSHPQEPDERIFLADFGIARWIDDQSGLTGTNMAVGTVAYAAPEQLMGDQVDGRVDQYALAATAFHMLTGTPLFQHSNPAIVISQHLSTPPPAIGTRRPALTDLDPVLSKALAKGPDDRYPTCVEFADALGRRLGTVAGESGATEATALAFPASGPRHRSRQQRTIDKPSQTTVAVVDSFAACSGSYLRAAVLSIGGMSTLGETD